MIAEQLITLLYGSIVKEILSTCENMTEANQRLQKIGHRIGTKMVDEFMKDAGKPCTRLAELVQRFTTVGVRRFLGAECKYEEYKLTEKGFSFNLKVTNNPLLKHLEIGESRSGLQYQSIFRGCVKGAMEVLKFKAQVIVVFERVAGDKNDTVFFVDAARA